MQKYRGYYEKRKDNIHTTLYAVWCKRGDTNLNGTVSLADIMHIRSHITGTSVFTDYLLISADVNCDGVIDDVDTLMIRDVIEETQDSSPQVEQFLSRATSEIARIK